MSLLLILLLLIPLNPLNKLKQLPLLFNSFKGDFTIIISPLLLIPTLIILTKILFKIINKINFSLSLVSPLEKQPFNTANFKLLAPCYYS